MVPKSGHQTAKNGSKDESALSDFRKALNSDFKQDEEQHEQPEQSEPKNLREAAERGDCSMFCKLADVNTSSMQILDGDFPYRYSSVLYAAYANQFTMLQVIEKKYAYKYCDEADKTDTAGKADEPNKLTEREGGCKHPQLHTLDELHGKCCWLGKNSVHVAAYQGHVETLLYLVDLDLKGGKFHEQLFEKADYMGKTPLIWAAALGHNDAVKVLLLRALYRILPEETGGEKQTSFQLEGAPPPPPPKQEGKVKAAVLAVRKTRLRLVRALFYLSRFCENGMSTMQQEALPARTPMGDRQGAAPRMAAVAAAGAGAAEMKAKKDVSSGSFFHAVLHDIEEGRKPGSKYSSWRYLDKVEEYASSHIVKSAQQGVLSPAGYGNDDDQGSQHRLQQRVQQHSHSGPSAAADTDAALNGEPLQARPAAASLASDSTLPASPRHDDSAKDMGQRVLHRMDSRANCSFSTAVGSGTTVDCAVGRSEPTDCAVGSAAAAAFTTVAGGGKTAAAAAMADGKAASAEEGVEATQHEGKASTAVPAVEKEGQQDDDSEWGEDEQKGMITEKTLLAVLHAAYEADINCLGVVLYMKELLSTAMLYDELVEQCEAWQKQLMDACNDKEEVQAILTPILRHDQSVPLVDEDRPSIAREGEAIIVNFQDKADPITYALATHNKHFLSHTNVQMIFLEKWDSMGVTDYGRSLLGCIWGFLLCCTIFTTWVVAWPFVIVGRCFLHPVHTWLARGRVADCRYAWHVPIYRWIMAQSTLLCFTILLLCKVFFDDTVESVDERTSPLSAVLAGWSVAILVDEVQDIVELGWTEYVSESWNLNDTVMALCYLASFVLKAVSIDSLMEVDLQMISHDLLAMSVIMGWGRVLSLFELSEHMGPLIATIKMILYKDITRFLLLALVVLLGFGVGIKALFAPICAERDEDNHECLQYSAWDYDWQTRDGVMGVLKTMNYLQYVALGNATPSDFEQKRVTGIIFYLGFLLLTSVLMLNLLISMMGATYSRVSEQAKVEFLYRRARIMSEYGKREAICPPYNLLHLAAAPTGNVMRWLLRRAWVVCRGRASPPPAWMAFHVSLRKFDKAPPFKFYFPKDRDKVRSLDMTDKPAPEGNPADGITASVAVVAVGSVDAFHDGVNRGSMHAAGTLKQVKCGKAQEAAAGSEGGANAMASSFVPISIGQDCLPGKGSKCQTSVSVSGLNTAGVANRQMNPRDSRRRTNSIKMRRTVFGRWLEDADTAAAKERLEKSMHKTLSNLVQEYTELKETARRMKK